MATFKWYAPPLPPNIQRALCMSVCEPRPPVSMLALEFQNHNLPQVYLYIDVLHIACPTYCIPTCNLHNTYSTYTIYIHITYILPVRILPIYYSSPIHMRTLTPPSDQLPIPHTRGEHEALEATVAARAEASDQSMNLRPIERFPGKAMQH